MSAGELGSETLDGTATTSRRVARNSALYFVSLGVPAVAALVFVPITVRALGPTRFGLLALAWAIAESTGIFDFGLGKATIRFVADATSRSRERLRDVVAASLITQTAMGIVAAVLFFVLVPLLVHRVFSIGAANLSEAVSMFRVLALHMPVLLFISSLRASLEGAQRFDVSTPLRIPSSLASVIVPAWAASAGYSLPVIMWVLLVVRVLLAALTALAVRQTLIGHWSRPRDFSILREMLKYSGWVAISTAAGPVLASFDRFTVGSVVGGAALGYYAGAAEAANRFLLVPVTAFSAVFPALAAVDAKEGRQRSLAVTRAARRQLMAVMFPLCATLFVFGPQLLGLWLGKPYALAAGLALRILAIAVFLAAVAILPLALLYGSGRPDLPAKINALQVALHIPITIALVKFFGITGAAIAMTVMRLEEVVLYQWGVRRFVGATAPDADAEARTRVLWVNAVVLLVTLAVAMRLLEISRLALVLALAGVVAYMWFTWMRVFTARERSAWRGMLGR
jgi:O-antigen/teichoic acid export membrane protein